ncbi:MAG: hypothetical protein Kow0056_11740 [Coriobacteriia bacterium]
MPLGEGASLAQRVYHEMRSVMRAHHRILFHRLGEKGTHPGQAVLLWVLSKNDGSTQSELAEVLCVSKPTVSVMLTKLEEAGLIERRPDDDDRRVRRIWLTEAGRALNEELHGVYADVVEATIGGLPEEDQAELLRLLAEVGRMLDQQTDERRDEAREGEPGDMRDTSSDGRQEG